MTPEAARRRARANRLGGALIMLVCAAFLFTGALLWVYNNVDLAGDGVASLSGDLRRLSYFVYRRTHWLPLVWEHAPVPDIHAPLSAGTLSFLGCYLGFFVGASLFAAGNALVRTLRGVDTESGRPTDASIPYRPFWKAGWTLYAAPVAVGLLCWMLIELARRVG